MVDLGDYAAEVLSAYALSLGLLAALVALTLWRGARVRRALAAAEARLGRGTAEAAELTPRDAGPGGPGSLTGAGLPGGSRSHG